MNYKKLIVDSGLRMLRGGYTVETWGNISARDPETNLVYLTPSGMDYTTIQEEDIVVLDLEGNIVEGHRKPSIELDLHLHVYQSRPEVQAVVHTHPIYSTVFSCCGEDIPMVIDEAAQVLGDVCRTAKYGLPGSKELAENCVEALGAEAMACLLRSHGAVCLGESLKAALVCARVLEQTCEIYRLAQSLGGPAKPFPKERVETMKLFLQNSYGQKQY